MTASWYSIRLFSTSCTAEYARICHSGGLVGSVLHKVQVVYTAWVSSLTLPSVRRAPLAASLPFCASKARMPFSTPSRMPWVNSA